jgi:N-acylneuraminate cytidylyltransferase/CMP-N,N'-diacetyllegionaminic acid synthase
MVEKLRLCTFCARGGSKGVKGKNTRLLAGKPMMVHTIEQALASGIFDTLAMSSDSEEILGIAAAAGVTHLVKRPDELATDQAAKLPVIRHCVAEVERRIGRRFATLVDLDVTSPLRTTQDIREAVAQHESTGAPNLITAMPARRSPYFNLVEMRPDGSIGLAKKPETPIARRQDAPRCFDLNASIYVWSHDTLFGSETLFNPGTQLYVMPEERSIDVDSELDFEFVEFLLTRARSAS